MNLKDMIRNVPDFPKKGIQFKDITTLIKDKDGFKETVEWMVSLFKDKSIDKVVAVESRGFIFGAPVAIALNTGIVLVRKDGRLPAETISVKYDLEYGEGILEMHINAIQSGERVIIIDDLLATGGTTRATIEIMEKVSAEVVGICCVVELQDLNGREKLKPYPVQTLIKYEGT